MASPSSPSPDEIGVILPFCLPRATLKVACLPIWASVDILTSLGRTQGSLLVAPFLLQGAGICCVSSWAHVPLGEMSVSRGSGNAEEGHPLPLVGMSGLRYPWTDSGGSVESWH